MKSKYDLELAHKYSSNNIPDLRKDSICGCFYCLSIFSPDEIEEYILDDNPIDNLGTAICPHCGVDAVISESSGFPITKDFLQEMYQKWF